MLRHTERLSLSFTGFWLLYFLLTTRWCCFRHTRSFESFPETVSASQGFICPSLPFQFSRVFMTKPGLGTESSRWVTELLSDRVVCNPWLWIIHLSPFHTARWSRKIARKLPECLLCERKHVPGLIPGLIPGWGPSNIAGFSPGTSAA